MAGLPRGRLRRGRAAAIAVRAAACLYSTASRVAAAAADADGMLLLRYAYVEWYKRHLYNEKQGGNVPHRISYLRTGVRSTTVNLGLERPPYFLFP